MSKQLDAVALSGALAKVFAGQDLTTREAKLVRSYETLRSDAMREELLGAIPLTLWRQLAGGLQHKELVELHGSLGAPPIGRTVDLGAFLAWAYKVLREHIGIAHGDQPDSWGDRLQREKYLRARLDRMEREKQLVSLEAVERCTQVIAQRLRVAGETLERSFGADALEVLNSAIEAASMEIEGLDFSFLAAPPFDLGLGDGQEGEPAAD